MKQLGIGVRMAAAIAAGTIVAVASAGAQTTFAGNTFGCFYSGTTAPANCTGLMSTTGGLSYTGSTFSVTSNPVDGLVSIGREAGSANHNNLGSFTLSDGNHDYTGQNFALFVNFTQPAGVAGNNLYTAMVSGNLSTATSGNVFVDFVNTPHDFTFADGSTLNFSVDDVSINDEATGTSTVAITGHGFTHAATVPEPTSTALLGTGLIGLVPLVRRRRKV